MSLSNPDSLDRNAAPDAFSPYNAIFKSINVPSSSPNYGPANVQIVSLKGAVRYAFCISHASISISFNAVIVKAILTESLGTTGDNVIEEGAVVDAFLYTASLSHKMSVDPSMGTQNILSLYCNAAISSI